MIVEPAPVQCFVSPSDVRANDTLLPTAYFGRRVIKISRIFQKTARSTISADLHAFCLGN